MKALVIRSPWIDLILSGQKAWEMRTRPTSIRGRIALIKAGSGMVYGTAELVNCLPPLDAEQMRQQQQHHAIPDAELASALENRWTTPWVLRDIRPLPKPAPYQHPSGAVTWVELPEFSEAGAQPMTRSTSATVMPNQAVKARAATPTISRGEAIREVASPVAGTRLSSGQWADITLSQGNINNNHFSLRSAISLLPKDSIGGKNKAEAGKPIQVHFQGGGTVETDVDGDKMILRRRGPIGDFFARAGCSAGDTLRITRVSEREFHVSRNT
jgi:hypothetical protein